MSKSIYEEAIEKIDAEFDSWDRAEYFELVELVEQALEQAKKQQKLLELYKEKDKLKDFFAMGSIRAEKYKKIEKQIKELEDE